MARDLKTQVVRRERPLWILHGFSMTYSVPSSYSPVRDNPPMADSSEPGESTVRGVFPPAPQAQLGEQVRPAILSVLALTFLTGAVFPLLLFAIGRPLFPRQAGGSLLTRGGVTIGSQLIGQE